MYGIDKNRILFAIVSVMGFHLCITVLCQNGDIRLVNGTTAFEGRVEICWNETWGTICDGFWSGFDAQVACGQLGYSRNGMYMYKSNLQTKCISVCDWNM